MHLASELHQLNVAGLRRAAVDIHMRHRLRRDDLIAAIIAKAEGDRNYTEQLRGDVMRMEVWPPYTLNPTTRLVWNDYQKGGTL